MVKDIEKHLSHLIKKIKTSAKSYGLDCTCRFRDDNDGYVYLDIIFDKKLDSEEKDSINSILNTWMFLGVMGYVNISVKVTYFDTDTMVYYYTYRNNNLNAEIRTKKLKQLLK